MAVLRFQPPNPETLLTLFLGDNPKGPSSAKNTTDSQFTTGSSTTLRIQCRSVFSTEGSFGTSRGSNNPKIEK